MYFALYTVQNSIKGLCNFESQQVLECGTVLTEQRIGQGPSSTYIQNMLQISQDARQLLNREAHMHCITSPLSSPIKVTSQRRYSSVLRQQSVGNNSIQTYHVVNTCFAFSS